MVRIISGEFRGRKLATPRDDTAARPLPDRVRTALFNMLVGHVAGETFLDAYAGTGAFGLEALSRGASSCVFIERDRAMLTLLRRNIESLGVGDRAEVVPSDVLGAVTLARCPRPLHVALFDPPYPAMRDPAMRARVMAQLGRVVGLLDEGGYGILRTPWPFEDRDADEPSRRIPVPLGIDGTRGPETHAYGSTAVHWYMREA